MKLLQFLALFINISWIFAQCVFNGSEYEAGQVIAGICFDLYCIEKFTWETNEGIYKENCKSCTICNDPHFTTFDNYHYDWHGYCNYTISQPINFDECDQLTFEPLYAIYGDFKLCRDNSVSCLDCTTYKVAEHTSVDIMHSSLDIWVNGEEIFPTGTPTTVNIGGILHPLIAWIDKTECINLQGVDFSMIICIDCLYIWTTTDSHLETLAGLCGFFSGRFKDDFLARDCTFESVNHDPFFFPPTWKTLVQKDDICYENFEGDIKPPCENEEEFFGICLNECIREFADELPEDILQNLLTDCMIDLCANPEETEYWCQVTYEKAAKASEIGQREAIEETRAK